MEFQRRIGHGRLSEVFGAATLPQDRFLRTVGFGRAAQQRVGRHCRLTRKAAGERLRRRRERIHRARITARGCRRSSRCCASSPSRGAESDVLVWVKMMAWDLSANYSFELLRHDLVRTVGAERMAQLMPPYARDGLSILDRRSPRRPSGARGDSVGHDRP